MTVCTPAARLIDGGWEPCCTCPNSNHIPMGVGLLHADDRDALAEARALLNEREKEEWGAQVSQEAGDR